ncbi:MAG: DUF192 domain-containing protein [Actinobacteria bacterium]|uniref:Unannotated protein n=1 Tax=freshwater metagenome TaxID=449393 RepID=A0A6J6A191_9ZZZZ|nr:DUF192 domain-containing protein [Actinomycetota bacterium]
MIVEQARGVWARTRGLSWRDRSTVGYALHLPRCRSVHTFGMRFALDLIWLDASGKVVGVDREVRPLRIRSCRRAASVIEVVAGEGHGLLESGYTAPR